MFFVIIVVLMLKHFIARLNCISLKGNIPATPNTKSHSCHLSLIKLAFFIFCMVGFFVDNKIPQRPVRIHKADHRAPMVKDDERRTDHLQLFSSKELPVTTAQIFHLLTLLFFLHSSSLTIKVLESVSVND